MLYCLNQGFPNTMLSTTLGFSLLAISYALLVLAALSSRSVLSRISVPGAGSLALWSYAVYLVHKPVFMIAAPHLRRMNIDANAPLTVLLMFAAGIFGGWLLFRLVETPFMRVRARWYPSNRPAAQTAPPVAAAMRRTR